MLIPYPIQQQWIRRDKNLQTFKYNRQQSNSKIKMKSLKVNLSSELDTNNHSHRIVSYLSQVSPSSQMLLSKGRTPKAADPHKIPKRINSEETQTRRNSKSINHTEDKNNTIKDRDNIKDKDNNKDKESSIQSKKKLGSELDSIYKQLITLKAEYKSLKQSYNATIRQKLENNNLNDRYETEISQLKHENGELRKQIEVCKNQMDFCDHELERIKRESFKLLEIENFKIQKLQENLNEKESMILYLKNRDKSELKDIFACSAPNNLLQSTSFFNSKTSTIIDAPSPKQTINFNQLNDSTEKHENDCKSMELLKHKNRSLFNVGEDEKQTRRKDDSDCSSSEEIELVYKKEMDFKKKSPIEALLENKSPQDKKKRSVTGTKTSTAVKKSKNCRTLKLKKLPNETFR